MYINVYIVIHIYIYIWKTSPLFQCRAKRPVSQNICIRQFLIEATTAQHYGGVSRFAPQCPRSRFYRCHAVLSSVTRALGLILHIPPRPPQIVFFFPRSFARGRRHTEGVVDLRRITPIPPTHLNRIPDLISYLSFRLKSHPKLSLEHDPRRQHLPKSILNRIPKISQTPHKICAWENIET